LAAVAATASAGLKIHTSVDTVGAFVSTPCVGCVTAAAASALTTGVVQGTAKTLSLTFTTVSVIPNSGVITLEFPKGFVTAIAAAKGTTDCDVSSPAPSAPSGSAYAAGAAAQVGPPAVAAGPDVITITLAAGATVAAGTVTVTCSGLTIGALAAVAATASAGLKIHTSVDTVGAFVSTPCVGCVAIDFSGSSTFSATWSEAKQLEIIGAVDVWTASASSAVTCTVGSFTNAPFTSAQRRSLLQSTEVEIITANAAGVPLTTSSTGQTFPLSVVVTPSRALYLPKASGAAFGVAWMCVAVSALLFWL
jgi:hypothetical protein